MASSLPLVRSFSISLILTLLIAGCGGTPGGEKTVPDATLSPGEHERKGLDMAERRDYKGALVELQAAQSAEPMAVRRLGVAHLLYMQKKYDEAVESYQAYLASTPHLPKSQRIQLNNEIARISAALDNGDEPQGRSLAGQWLRGRLAWLRAEEARDRGDLKIAIANYDKAFQYSGDVEMLFEEALVATRAGDLHKAVRKFSEYLSIGVNDIRADRAYRVNAEIDRINTILAGETPVTDESLAEEIYSERSGERASDGRAPSVERELEEERLAMEAGEVALKTEPRPAVQTEAKGGDAAEASAAALAAEEARLKAEEDARIAAVEKERKEREREERRLEEERSREEAKVKKEAEARAREAARLAGIEAKRAEEERKKAEHEASAEKSAEEKERKRQEALAKKREAEEARKAEREVRLAAKKAEKERKEAEREARLAAKKAEKERKKAEREARLAAKKAEKERKKAEREARLAAKKAEAKSDDTGTEGGESYARLEDEAPSDTRAPLKGTGGVGEATGERRRKETSLEDLIFYSRSISSSVRFRAVKDITAMPDDRARQVLEERVMKDTNRQVRYAAMEGLVARRSRGSIPVLRQAIMTASTSEERARMKNAIDRLLGIRR